MTISVSNVKRLATSRAGVAAISAAAAAATAAWVEVKARSAERENPPAGQFIEIDGVRLHYVMRGEGPPVVLLHGNNVSHADFTASGLISQLAVKHRVIAFDRPGFGHSTRPRDRLWTPTAQAALFQAALEQLGIEEAVVVGHSMGTMVALAMALDYPDSVRSLVLIGGYFYPTLRVDALLTAPVALPVLGDVMRYTVTAVSARAMLNTMVKAMFAPREVPPSFLPTLAREMLLRPVQLRANAEDAAFMIPQARALSKRYQELRLPVTLIAGAEDMVVDLKAHSERLHNEMPRSQLHIVPAAGHMVHYMAQDLIMTAIDNPQPALAPENHAASLADSVTPQAERELAEQV
ncbi:MAG: Alpha/beta hydrolase superfamily-like protein [Polaromonas sp.]|nr:Alpha/beta hydrolase superfamily-like protein [Polaromonas sp.]